ncbi:MAG: tRNA dihydrouridine synthase DusB [Clostridia bacterium]|nr:tRNA dihydrouridine synthase DusB [Clostridia bacterium]
MNIGSYKIDGFASLAPMAGAADRAFREICRSFGAAMVTGELASAKGISRMDKKSQLLLQVSPAERPMSVQLFGCEPEVMAQSAQIAMQYEPDFLDINMGCPAPKVTAGGGGSSLMKDPALCGEIVRAVCEVSKVPVTVKIRKGWDENTVTAVEVAGICEKNGAAAIAIHGRTREQMYSGQADWDIIKQVKRTVSIPVIGNGDITTAEKAGRMLEYTGCDMVMVGRGALGNPWIFSEIGALLGHGAVLPPPSIEEKMLLLRRQAALTCEYKGEYTAMREIRKHITWYIKGMRGAAALRGLAGTVKTMDELDLLIKQVLLSQIKGE